MAYWLCHKESGKHLSKESEEKNKKQPSKVTKLTAYTIREENILESTDSDIKSTTHEKTIYP